MGQGTSLIVEVHHSSGNYYLDTNLYGPTNNVHSGDASKLDKWTYWKSVDTAFNVFTGYHLFKLYIDGRLYLIVSLWVWYSKIDVILATDIRHVYQSPTLQYYRHGSFFFEEFYYGWCRIWYLSTQRWASQGSRKFLGDPERSPYRLFQEHMPIQDYHICVCH